MKNEIDLSKAYAGQIAHLNDGNEFTIKSIKFVEKYNIYDINLVNSEIWHYTKEGIYLGGTDCKYPIHLNISNLEDDYFVQCARIEGEIKGLEFAITNTNNAADARVLFKRLHEVQTELLTLQSNQ